MDAHPTSTSAAESLGSDFFYGWDLLFRTVEQRISKKADVLMVLAHFMLTKHSNFRCIGIGDDKSLPHDESGSELLPDQWNGDSAKYSLRYVQNKMLFLLLAHITEDALVINLLDVNTKNVTNLCLSPDTLVADFHGSIARTLPTASLIVDRIRKELYEPLLAVSSRETTQATQAIHQQVSQTPVQTDPLLIDGPRRPMGYVPQGLEPNPYGLPDVGRGDLNPLGGGPGNLFPYPRNPGPIRPNVPGQGAPNPDHAHPPDWNPDQYM